MAGVSFKGKWVKTERYQKQVAAQRQLYGYYRNPFTDDDSVKDLTRPNRRTVSNTSPIAHAGKLFTLKEDGLPHQIDPNTLRDHRAVRLGGAYKSETSPRTRRSIRVTGEMIAYGYRGHRSHDGRCVHLGRSTRPAR